MDKPLDQLPTLDTTLMEFPHAEICFSCALCTRGGPTRVAACAAKFGPNVRLVELLYRFMRRCPHNPYDERRKPRKYGWKCGARIDGLDPTVEPYVPSMLAREIEEAIRRKRYLGG
ncbi:hypothetical protein [Chelatococcus reniformis]|uniref:Uncharacterized protein n=1 Tax=Chelatococcus reniformis TaxID=1494448 RepID=A0A916UK73_9HYPH|nr:hypothetical protein [Chelatococcus reniformis]GGC75982.1 hypothetical protein GCM10010994_37960 [Chelatococcus reniformis]